jgi:hypothetical protein
VGANVQPAVTGAAGSDEQIRVFEQLELEQDKLDEASQWLFGTSAADAAELSLRLWPFWYQRGFYREAREAFDQVLTSRHEIPAGVRATTGVHVSNILRKLGAKRRVDAAALASSAGLLRVI